MTDDSDEEAPATERGGKPPKLSLADVMAEMQAVRGLLDHALAAIRSVADEQIEIRSTVVASLQRIEQHDRVLFAAHELRIDDLEETARQQGEAIHALAEHVGGE